jgi:chromosome partitioning protein
MTRVLAVTNQKGGVGKTTTSINLAAALADLGHRTLLVDMDPQAHTTLGMGIDSANVEKTVFHVLTAGAHLTEVLQETADERLLVAPAHMDLSFADEALMQVEGRDVRLARRLHEVRDLFDYVVIDSPAQLNLLTINTMAAATEVIIPVHSQYYSYAGLGQVLETIGLMRGLVNPQLVIGGVVVTQFDRRLALHRRAVERLRAEVTGTARVYETVIPHGVRAQYASELHVPVVRSFPSSPVARAYKELAAEVALSGEVAGRTGRGQRRTVLRGSDTDATVEEIRRLTSGQPALTPPGPIDRVDGITSDVDVRRLRTGELVRGCLARGITHVRARSVLEALRADLASLEGVPEADASGLPPAPAPDVPQRSAPPH